MKKTAVFPGSFDPFTVGHKIIVDEGLKLFDKVIIAIGVNSVKPGFLALERRIELIRDIYRENGKVEVVAYSGLTVEFCREVNARFMLRGMRNMVDFEYERNMMQINQALYPEIMTVLLFTPPEYVAISSSIVREVSGLGGDVSRFLPDGIDIKKYLK